MAATRWAVIGVGLGVLAACSDTTDPESTNPDRVSQQIGAAGGVITSKDSILTLTIPPGALSSDVTITIAPVAPEDLGSEWDAVGVDRAYELGPDGTSFAVPVEVSLRSDQVPVVTDSGTTVHPEALLTASAGILEPLDSVGVEVSGNGALVRGFIGHFSIIAIKRVVGVEFGIRGVIPDELYVGQGFPVTAWIQFDETARDSMARLNPAHTITEFVGEFWANATNALEASPATHEETLLSFRYEVITTYTCVETGAGRLLPFLRLLVRTAENPTPLAIVGARHLAANRSVNCRKAPVITINLAGPGGTVTISTPDAPSSVCTLDAPDACIRATLPGEEVTLTPNALDGFVFGGFGGTCAAGEVGEGGTVVVRMPDDGSDVKCDARFNPLVTATVRVNGPSSGAASVELAPLAESCAKIVGQVLATCLFPVPQGTALTFTATPGDGIRFTGWIVDDVVVSTAVLVLAMGQSHVIDAIFEVIEASPLQFVARWALAFLADALGAGIDVSPLGAGWSGSPAATQAATSIFVGDAGTSGDVLELSLANPANITQVGSGGLCPGLTSVVHTNDATYGQFVWGFSATDIYGCFTAYPLGQGIQSFNMGAASGKAIVMPGNPSTVLATVFGSSRLRRMTLTGSTDVVLTPSARSCPRFLASTATTAYVVTVEGTVGTTTEPCNTNRGVYRVDLGSNTVTGSVGFGTNPRDPVLSADGSTLYVPDFAENRIHVVATQTMQVTRTIDVTGGPVAVALTADGSHLIVARWTLNDIALIDLATDEIVGSTDSQGVHPTALRIRPDNVVVVLNYGDYPTGSTTGSVATFRYTLP